MPLNAGQLNRVITIQSRVAGVDAWGQPTQSWETLAITWAWIKAVSGASAAEQMAGDQQTSSVNYSVRVRYRTDVTAGMRITTNGQTLDIVGVVLDHAGREYTDIVCIEGARDGG